MTLRRPVATRLTLHKSRHSSAFPLRSKHTSRPSRYSTRVSLRQSTRERETEEVLSKESRWRPFIRWLDVSPGAHILRLCETTTLMVLSSRPPGHRREGTVRQQAIQQTHRRPEARGIGSYPEPTLVSRYPWSTRQSPLI
jgi:hypothetical protein